MPAVLADPRKAQASTPPHQLQVKPVQMSELSVSQSKSVTKGSPLHLSKAGDEDSPLTPQDHRPQEKNHSGEKGAQGTKVMKRGVRGVGPQAPQRDRGCGCALVGLEGSKSDGGKPFAQISKEAGRGQEALKPTVHGPGQGLLRRQLPLDPGFSLPSFLQLQQSWGLTASIRQP